MIVVGCVLRRRNERFRRCHVGLTAVEVHHYRGLALGGEEVSEEVLGVMVRTRGTLFPPWVLWVCGKPVELRPDSEVVCHPQNHWSTAARHDPDWGFSNSSEVTWGQDREGGTYKVRLCEWQGVIQYGHDGDILQISC